MQIQASTTYRDCKVGLLDSENITTDLKCNAKSDFLPKSIVNIDTPFPTKQAAILRRTRNKPKLILPYGSSLKVSFIHTYKVSAHCTRTFVSLPFTLPGK